MGPSPIRAFYFLKIDIKFFLKKIEVKVIYRENVPLTNITSIVLKDFLTGHL